MPVTNQALPILSQLLQKLLFDFLDYLSLETAVCFIAGWLPGPFITDKVADFLQVVGRSFVFIYSLVIVYSVSQIEHPRILKSELEDAFRI